MSEQSLAYGRFVSRGQLPWALIALVCLVALAWVAFLIYGVYVIQPE